MIAFVVVFVVFFCCCCYCCFYEEGAESFMYIYIVGLNVSLFYPEILQTYLLLSELFVRRKR